MRFRISRHFQVYMGPDFYGRRPFHIIFAAIERPAPPQGELKYRITVEINFNPFPRIYIGTIPAWTEVPSVEAEYWRTMEPVGLAALNALDGKNYGR